MKLVAVVAASDNDVIGRDNALPWYQPADLAFFKRVTMGKPILMGRRTYDSIGKPLPGRLNIVLSRAGFTAPGVAVARTLDEACELAAGAPELMVIGGAMIFDLAMPRMDHIHLTRVHCIVEGDVFLPALQPGEWQEVSRKEHPADERNVYAMSFIELARVRAAGAS
ncbi:MAG: dihydrofolate reductase [Steroidobacteraceae bacterium]